MAQLIIGLFPSAEQAAHAMHELSSIGVPADQIVTLSAGDERERAVGQPGQESATSPLAEESGAQAGAALIQAGLPPEQAWAYASAVAKGSTVLAIVPGGVPGANIKAVLLSNGAAEVDGPPEAERPIAPNAISEPGEAPPELQAPEVAPPADGYRVAGSRDEESARAEGDRHPGTRKL